MTGPYDDIINLPHHISATRARMPLADRAAQFSPFAALTGHSAAIKETARLTEQRIELGEDSKAALELRLNMLADAASNHPEVAVTYFQPDENKEGGSYVTATSVIKRIDSYERVIDMVDSTKIPIEEILKIESTLFKEQP